MYWASTSVDDYDTYYFQTSGSYAYVRSGSRDYGYSVRPVLAQ